MPLNKTRLDRTPPADSRDVQRNTLFLRAERSLTASGVAGNPAAGTVLCTIQGMLFSTEPDIYKVEWQCGIFGINSQPALDIGLYLENELVKVLPHTIFTFQTFPSSGIVYLAPNRNDVSIRVIAGQSPAAGSYMAALTATRLKNGFRVG